jgi:hypothetical protein
VNVSLNVIKVGVGAASFEGERNGHGHIRRDFNDSGSTGRDEGNSEQLIVLSRGLNDGEEAVKLNEAQSGRLRKPGGVSIRAEMTFEK